MKKEYNIPFSPPDVGEEEIAQIGEAIRSGWITTGPRTKKLERRLAEWVGADRGENETPRCVCLSSQTACAEMALHIMGIGPGDEVIVPAYTYTASASVVAHVSATLVLVDSQPNSFQMDYDAVERAVTERTKAIIPVDIGGIPCDYERLFQIVKEKKPLFQPSSDMQRKLGRIAVMADTAHSLGASYRGVMCGSVADFSSFSFHAVKNLTTAEGGALTWNHINGADDGEIYERLQLLSLHGQNKDAYAKARLGAWEYDIIGTWYKCNMTDISAAIGLKQLERYPGMLARRREIIKRYDDAFSPLGVITPVHFSPEYTSCGHLYITRVPGITPQQRNEIIEKAADCGISCNVHYKPLPMHTAYKRLGFDISDFPNAYAQFADEITLPLHTRLTDEEVEYIIYCYTKILREYL